MIRGEEIVNPPVQIKTQEETIPRHGPQSHDVVPYLETAGDGTHEQQTVDLSSRTITDLSSGLNNLHLENTSSSTVLHDQGVPEASGHNGQDNPPTQQMAPRKPYPGVPKEAESKMNNDPPGNYCARYANIPKGYEPETVRIGNQELMTLDQSFVDPNMAAGRAFAEVFNFSFLADFLSKIDNIEYIVDVGCDGGDFSLTMQNYLRERGFQIKVIPVEVFNFYDGRANDIKPFPINILPAQEIANASPLTTLFTAIRPCTGSSSDAKALSREIAQGVTDFNLTTLIKNNPDCFVLTAQGPYSSPQNYIPPELVYTKHCMVSVNPFSPGDHGPMALRKAKAAEMNAENSDIYRLNQLLAILPEQRDNYLASIAAIKDKLQLQMLREPEVCWSDIIFRVFLAKMLSIEWGRGVHIYDDIVSDLQRNGFLIDCWHVYCQDAKATEFQSANPPVRVQPEPEKAGFLGSFCKIL
ncbi:hypothetical protein J7438_19785 [Thalassotalea sp. G20_0]|uniref:hypothetical protein n=1 Tax=Thalassotalea sp. G20_0 TaxID=2821093 RepID=UPI001ADBFAE1|nr:hypothetical protein [Thalassotalea sp. G20_0]MBO9496300.1 hypothetical protein [Thalassotalea sp. G20_0]